MAEGSPGQPRVSASSLFCQRDGSSITPGTFFCKKNFKNGDFPNFLFIIPKN